MKLFGYDIRIYKEPKLELNGNTFDNSSLKRTLEFANNVHCKKFYILDRVYESVPYGNLREWMLDNPTSEDKYISEIWDCNKFAFQTMTDVKRWNPTIPFGVAMGKSKKENAHAWNVYVESDTSVWYVEPQTDEIFRPTTEEPWVIII